MDTPFPDRLASRNCVIRETDLPRPARPLSRTNQPTINHPLVTSFVPSILSTRPPAPESDNHGPAIPEKTNSGLSDACANASADRKTTRNNLKTTRDKGPFILIEKRAQECRNTILVPANWPNGFSFSRSFCLPPAFQCPRSGFHGFQC